LALPKGSKESWGLQRRGFVVGSHELFDNLEEALGIIGLAKQHVVAGHQGLLGIGSG